MPKLEIMVPGRPLPVGFSPRCGGDTASLLERLRKARLPLVAELRRHLADLTETIMGDVLTMEHAYSHVLGELWCAVIASAIVFVGRMPQGYDTMIGENGSKLSGGERQRISIARALLKGASIVLLDEATASLDVENETQVQEALSRLLVGKTVIVIAHRMRTVENADKVVVLKGGVVAEQGSPAEVKAAGGEFVHMVELQRGSAGWRL